MTEGAEAAVDLVDVDALEAVEVLKVPEFLENSIFRKLHLQEYFPRENLSVLWSSIHRKINKVEVQAGHDRVVVPIRGDLYGKVEAT